MKVIFALIAIILSTLAFADNNTAIKVTKNPTKSDGLLTVEEISPSTETSITPPQKTTN